jgi:hypothetical protein
MICPNCDQEADFTVEVNEPQKTARIIAAHVEGGDGPWLRDSLLSKSYQAKLLKRLAEQCREASK